MYLYTCTCTHEHLCISTHTYILNYFVPCVKRKQQQQTVSISLLKYVNLKSFLGTFLWLASPPGSGRAPPSAAALPSLCSLSAFQGRLSSHFTVKLFLQSMSRINESQGPSISIGLNFIHWTIVWRQEGILIFHIVSVSLLRESGGRGWLSCPISEEGTFFPLSL